MGLILNFRRLRIMPKRLRLSKANNRLIFMLFVYMIGWGIVMPFFPIFLRSHSLSYTAIGILLGLCPIFNVIFALFDGTFMDRYPKKKVIKFSLLLYVPMGYIIIRLTTFFHFFLFQIYHSFAATSLWLSSEAYLRSHSNKKESAAFALYDFSTAMAVIIGAIMGSYLMASFGFNMFFSITIFSIIGFIAAFSLPDHKKAVISFVTLKQELSDFWRNKKLVKIHILIVALAIPYSIMVMLVPLFLNAFGTGYFTIGIIYALFSVPVLFEPYFTLFKKKAKLVEISFFTLILSFFLLSFVESTIVIVFLLMLLGLASSALYPLVLGKSTRLMTREHIGEYTAVSFSVRMFASGLGPIIAGIVSDLAGISAVFLLLGVLFILVLPLFKSVRW